MNDTKMRISAAWDRFLEDPTADLPDVRPEILESWRRSREYGVDSRLTRKVVLSPQKLKERIRANQSLYATALPIMEGLHEFVKDTGFMVLLCDKDGYVLKIVGDDNVKTAAEGNLLVEGAGRSEQDMGTNGIGTCIHLKKPLQIWADEHYYKPHCVWSCSAAPIFDPHGNFIGVLCMSGLWERVHFHTLGMVVSATGAISKQLALQNALTQANNAHVKLDKVVGLLNYGLIFVDGAGTILQINPLATLLLNIKEAEKSLIGRNIRDYLAQYGFDFNRVLAELDGQGEHEFDIDTFFGTLHCSIMVLTQADPPHPMEIALTIRKAEHIHKMVNRIVGSSAKFTWDDIVGQSPAIQEVKRLARVAAPYPSNVLLIGESGTGKELFAQAIHNASSRASAPFIAINCGALPRSLIESELFGYEGGSFTNSNRNGQAGKFELANGGTIFLDEIGDMPFDVQANLLRVLQTREVVRIGGKKSINIDVRIISATNKNLEESVANNAFREDLYYRLNVILINIPPLRSRIGDIKLLSDYMLIKFTTNFNKRVLGFADKTYEALESYSWPGNLRELENTIERAVLVCQGDVIQPGDLPSNLLWKGGDRPFASASGRHTVISVSQSEENLIRAAMSSHKGNIRKISKELGISRSTLYRKLAKYNINVNLLRE